MNLSDFQDIVAEALATIYHPTFVTLPPTIRENIVSRVREAYYALDINTPGSEIDYAAATLWAVQVQYNDVMLQLTATGLLSA